MFVKLLQFCFEDYFFCGHKYTGKLNVQIEMLIKLNVHLEIFN